MITKVSNNENAESGLLPYPVIIAATKGDPEAMAIVVKHYESYIGSTEKVEIGEYMQGNYNIYAKKPCRIRKCAPIRYFNDADHSLVMQYIHAGSTCVAPQNRHFCV